MAKKTPVFSGFFDIVTFSGTHFRTFLYIEKYVKNFSVYKSMNLSVLECNLLVFSLFSAKKFGIDHVPCYYWILCLLKLIKPESLNKCFMEWVRSFLPEKTANLTISIDGKTVCSTTGMAKYDRPLHIISAQISELGLTLAQRSIDDKSNEIPAVQEMLKELNIKGQMVVADALNCQKETAKIIIKKKADYLLCAKDNQPLLKKNIENFIQKEVNRNKLEIVTRTEKNRGRTVNKTAYVTSQIDWLDQKNEWNGLCCIGTIHSEVSAKNGNSDEWHYYISSRKLIPDELLHHARMEWSVESMHWLLDVLLEEDWCRVEDKTVQQNLNMFRKAAINLIKLFKQRTETKRPISNIMLDCLIDCSSIARILDLG